MELKSVEDTSWLQLFIKNTATIYLQPHRPSRARRYNLPGRTLSRSYGANLPSSFSRVLSSALGFSPCPPVSVCGTVSLELKLRGFSWKRGIDHFGPEGPRYHLSAKPGGFAYQACLLA